MPSSQPSAPAVIATAHHELSLFPEMDALFDRLDADAARAQRRIWIETYIYRADKLGRAFAEKLAAAAARGVEVRLLYDALGSQATDSAFFEELCARGIEARPYRPLGVALLSGRWWPRDHSRVIVIDDEGFTGGAAWGDEWLPRERGGLGWHDVCSRVRGPCVAEFVDVFERRWDEAMCVERPAGTGTPNDANDDRALYSDLEFVADTAARANLVFRRHRERIQRAARRVWIENAYFFPPRPLLADLYAAAARGVDVKVIIPKDSDLRIIDQAARAEHASWLARGVKLYEFVPSMVHAKFAVVDDDWATIGTFNANATSTMWANEANLFVYDEAFVAEVALLFRRDLARSEPLTAEAGRARPFCRRVRDTLSKLLLRFLEDHHAPPR